MIQLQSNFTTIEQSKRLLALGVPADSADMFYHYDQYPNIKAHAYMHIPQKDSTPCWSVGRLIEILKICVTDNNELHEIFEELEMCIDEIKTLVQTFKEYSEVMDFSKLEK